MKIQKLLQIKVNDMGLNLHQLHKETGIPYSSLGDFMKPSHRVDLVKLGLICQVIGIKPWALIREADEGPAIKEAESHETQI